MPRVAGAMGPLTVGWDESFPAMTSVMDWSQDESFTHAAGAYGVLAMAWAGEAGVGDMAVTMDWRQDNDAARFGGFDHGYESID